jgi:teichuronic acid biosynthesis glycosyltransferase TuaC
MKRESPGEGAAPAPLRVVVFSSLFPSAVAPAAGAFIRERMFRVAERVPLVVVSPQPWSPVDWIVRMKRPSFRPKLPRFETLDGVDVHRPRFLSLPAVGKTMDGLSMGACSYPLLRRLVRTFRPTLIDGHFLYPDGYAATLLGRWLHLPVTLTLRGSKDGLLLGTSRERFMRAAMDRATHLIAVSESLKRDVAMKLGQSHDRVSVIGNGVDTRKFARPDRDEARRRIGVPLDAKVLVSVGGLIESKGFHRLIPLLPALRAREPKLTLLIVGGGATHGDMRTALERLAIEHGVSDIVRFCGSQPPSELRWFYGAADVFTLATSYEGWANVFLEAMCSGLPVVTTRVGGNAEVVASQEVGTLVDYWDEAAFTEALGDALSRRWDRDAIVRYAERNSWDRRIEVLMRVLDGAARRAGTDLGSPIVPH